MGFGQMLFHGSLPYVFSCELAGGVRSELPGLCFRQERGVGSSIIILLGCLAALHPVFY